MSSTHDARPIQVLRPILLILARFIVMAACAFVLAIAVNEAMTRLLSPSGSLDESFRRLGRAVLVGGLAGIGLGGLLTHRLGQAKYPPEVRVYFAISAAIPFLIVVGLALIA